MSGCDWGPGWRFFECEECVHVWGDKSRDYTSPSTDPCPQCNEPGNYIGGVHRPEWPTDKFGNLTEVASAVGEGKKDE